MKLDFAGGHNPMKPGSAVRGPQTASSARRFGLTTGNWLLATAANPLRPMYLRVNLWESSICREFFTKWLIPIRQ